MKKITFLFIFSCLYLAGALSQTALVPVSWVAWADEPVHVETTGQGYINVPYEKEVYVAPFAPDGWTYDATTLDFEAAWNAIEGDPVPVANPGRIDGGDIYDGENFGAEWKAMWDADKVYILLRYVDAFSQVDDTRSFEICIQPKYYDRYEPDFIAAGDDVALQNSAYARYVELGGGKALFNTGAVTEYHSSIGADGNAAFGANEIGLMQLATEFHYWSVELDNTIQAVMVVDIEQVLSWATDPFGDISDWENRESLDPLGTPENDTLAFDVKSNGQIGGQNVEYWWSSQDNQGYASIYYNGYLILQQPAEDPGSVNDLLSQEINVYLNNGMLMLKNIEFADIQVYNITGQIVRSATNVSRLNISDLKEGIYLVRLNKQPRTYKIVIQ